MTGMVLQYLPRTEKAISLFICELMHLEVFQLLYVKREPVHLDSVTDSEVTRMESSDFLHRVLTGMPLAAQPATGPVSRFKMNSFHLDHIESLGDFQQYFKNKSYLRIFTDLQNC